MTRLPALLMMLLVVLKEGYCQNCQKLSISNRVFKTRHVKINSIYLVFLEKRKCPKLAKPSKPGPYSLILRGSLTCRICKKLPACFLSWKLGNNLLRKFVIKSISLKCSFGEFYHNPCHWKMAYAKAMGIYEVWEEHERNPTKSDTFFVDCYPFKQYLNAV